MPWKAPQIARQNVPYVAGERQMLEAWLDFHEEYARHNGHADLLRERVDGATGL